MICLRQARLWTARMVTTLQAEMGTAMETLPGSEGTKEYGEDIKDCANI